jgi:hypothetical protein
MTKKEDVEDSCRWLTYVAAPFSLTPKRDWFARYQPNLLLAYVILNVRWGDAFGVDNAKSDSSKSRKIMIHPAYEAGKDFI